MITKATSPGYLYAVTTDSTCLITDVDTRYNLCKAVVNKQGMFVAIGGSVECSDDNVLLTQASTTSGGTRFEVVTTRPEVGETGVIYLVPASNSTTENLYEEWVWVDDKWEQIGSAGLNLSNYAQLTTANTFSAANTFNGNLIKKTSSSLADNSVLNRSEMDSRYGKLSGGNSWNGDQTINGVLLSSSLRTSGIISLEGSEGQVGLSAMTPITIGSDLVATRNAEIKGNLSVYGLQGIRIHSVSGLLELNQLDSWRNAEGQKNSCIQVLASLDLHNNKLKGVHTGYMDNLYVDRLHSTSSQISVGRSIHMGNNNITHVNLFEAKSMHLSGGATVMGTLVASNINSANGDLAIKTPYGATRFVHDVNMRSSVSIVGNLGVVGTLTAGSDKDTIDVAANLHMQGNDIKEVASISSPNGISIGIKSSIHAYGHSIYEVDELALTTLKASSFSAKSDIIDVTSSLHFPLGNGSYVDPDIVIANAELRAVDLSMILGGEDKYGIRVTNTSCQLFGIDFAYGDVWSETNDAIKAQGATPMPGLDSATYFDTVKIKKPAVSIETTGIGSLSFDYANTAYIRTFPNDGGQGIFEFQAGNWTNSDADLIKRGPVDLRKASATTLGPTSVLNMEEGDARWGNVNLEGVLADYKLANNLSVPTKTELNAVDNIGNEPAYGVAIGPGVTANVYRDIAIGGWLNTSEGKGNNTLLGYGFRLGSGVENAIVIGRGNSTVIETSNTIFIGRTSSFTAGGHNSVAINGSTSGGGTVAISGTAGPSAVAIGEASIAERDAVAIGEKAFAGMGGTALGAYSVAGRNMLVLQAGNIPAVSMQLYGGESWEDRNDTGYLRFVTAKLQECIDDSSAPDREEITISKPNLWSALDRAKYRGAQPYAFYPASLVGNILALEPNSITHIAAYNSGASMDLSGITLAQYTGAITTAELWIEVTSNGTTITWPEGLLWPDEADPTVAPSFSGPEASTEVGYITQRLYCVTLRTQQRRNISDNTFDSVLIASIAYTVDSKLPIAAGGGGD